MPVELPNWGFTQKGESFSRFDVLTVEPAIITGLDTVVERAREQGYMAYGQISGDTDPEMGKVIKRAGQMLPLVLVRNAKSPKVVLSVNLPKDPQGVSTVTIESGYLEELEGGKVRVIRMGENQLGLCRRAKNRHDYTHLAQTDASSRHILSLLVEMLRVPDLSAQLGFFLPAGTGKEWASIREFIIRQAVSS